MRLRCKLKGIDTLECLLCNKNNFFLEKKIVDSAITCDQCDPTTRLLFVD